MPASLRICHTVDGASLCPRPASSPWMRQCPQPGFSRAISSTSARTVEAVRGLPVARPESPRSAHDGCGVLTWRWSTVTWYRRMRISASLARSERAIKASQPNMRRTAR